MRKCLLEAFTNTMKIFSYFQDYHPHHAQQQQHHQQYVPNQQHHHQQQQQHQQILYAQQHHQQQQQHIAQMQQQQEVIQSATPSTYMPQHQQHAYRPTCEFFFVFVCFILLLPPTIR